MSDGTASQAACPCILARHGYDDSCPIHGVKDGSPIFTNPFHLTHDLKHLFDITKSIYSNQRTIMATLAEVQAAQAVTAQAIAAIADRIPAPAATATDLDGLLATEQSNAAAANAIDPAPAPAA